MYAPELFSAGMGVQFRMLSCSCRESHSRSISLFRLVSKVALLDFENKKACFSFALRE